MKYIFNSFLFLFNTNILDQKTLIFKEAKHFLVNEKYFYYIIFSSNDKDWSFICMYPPQNVYDTTRKFQCSSDFKQVNSIEILHFVTSTKYIHESSPCQKNTCIYNH